MNLYELIKLQKKFDNEHGWTIGGSNDREILNNIKDDVIGLVGEIGEFSNILKKITLELNIGNPVIDHDTYEHMKEEAIDSFIYLIRIMSHLDIDIESEYIKKLKINTKRFEKFITGR